MIEVNSENYFSTEMSRKYMGSSQFKAFKKCESSALAELNGEYEREVTTSLLVGSYVDAHYEGTLDIFRAQHPEIFTRNGDLKSEYKHAETMIQRAERDELFSRYMAGEKQVIFIGEIAGVPYKIKVDSYHPDKAIVDLKCVKDFDEVYNSELGAWQHFIDYWGYDIQGAIYQEIVRQNTGKKLPFFIAAGTKEADGPDKKIIEIPQSYLDVELERFKKQVPYFDAIKKGLIEPERCEHCTFCKATKALTVPISLEALEYE